MFSLNIIGIETQLVLESVEVPTDFNLEEVEWFHKFLFEKILYIHRWNDQWSEHKYCRRFHVYPRLVHKSGSVLSRLFNSRRRQNRASSTFSLQYFFEGSF